MGLFDMFKKKDKVVKGNDNMEHIWNLTDTNNFVVAMTEHLNNKTQYGEDMSALSEAERIFYITQTLEMEVNNGGFSQFFFNSSGDFANEVVSAFEKIGATKTAEICKTAVSIYGESVPLDRDERESLLIDNDEVDDILNDCDNAFFEYEDDLTALNYQFIINNKDSFLK